MLIRLHHTALALLSLALATTALAKNDIAVIGNNTPYSNEDVQKLATTAVKMGVKEPVNLQLSGGNLQVSGSSKTTCTIKVGTNSKPQIAGISCQ